MNEKIGNLEQMFMSTNDKNNQEIEGLKYEIERLQEENQLLTGNKDQSISENTSKIENLQQQIEEMSSNDNNNQDLIQNLRFEIEKIRADNDVLMNNNDNEINEDIGKNAFKIEGLYQKIAQLENVNSQYSNELKRRDDENAALSSEISEMKYQMEHSLDLKL